MKKRSLLNLVLVLLMAGFMSGCGKDNKAAGAAVGAVDPNIVSNPISTNTSNSEWNSFASKLNNRGSFASDGGNAHFNFYNVSVSTSEAKQECDDIWIFNYCSYSPSTTSLSYTGTGFQRFVTTYNTTAYQHEFGTNLTQIHNGLLNIANKTVLNFTGYGNSYWIYVQESNGDKVEYEINFNYPLIANPVSKINYTKRDGYKLGY